MSSVSSSPVSSPAMAPVPSPSSSMTTPPPLSPTSLPQPTRRYRYRSRAQRNSSSGSDAYMRNTPGEDSSLRTHLQRLEVLQARRARRYRAYYAHQARADATEQLRRSRVEQDLSSDSSSLQNVAMPQESRMATASQRLREDQRTGNLGPQQISSSTREQEQERDVPPRYRTQSDIMDDTAMAQARARNEYITRVGGRNAAEPPPHPAVWSARMEGFDASRLFRQAQTITTSLGEIVQRRNVQRNGSSFTAVPFLDFEIDARMHPPPRPKDGERTLSV